MQQHNFFIVLLNCKMEFLFPYFYSSSLAMEFTTKSIYPTWSLCPHKTPFPPFLQCFSVVFYMCNCYWYTFINVPALFHMYMCYIYYVIPQV
jgi:hypothetical protein